MGGEQAASWGNPHRFAAATCWGPAAALEGCSGDGTRLSRVVRGSCVVAALISRGFRLTAPKRKGFISCRALGWTVLLRRAGAAVERLGDRFRDAEILQ